MPAGRGVSTVLNMNKAGPPGHADDTLQRFAEAHSFFYFYILVIGIRGVPTVFADARTDSVKTSVLLILGPSGAPSFSTFRASVESLLKQLWLTGLKAPTNQLTNF